MICGDTVPCGRIDKLSAPTGSFLYLCRSEGRERITELVAFSPAQRIILPTFRAGLILSVNPLCKHPHRSIQSIASLMPYRSYYPITFIIKIHYHVQHLSCSSSRDRDRSLVLITWSDMVHPSHYLWFTQQRKRYLQGVSLSALDLNSWVPCTRESFWLNFRVRPSYSFIP